jgi:ATP-binding cassette, subfamily B, multidrug efflux pump
MRALHDDGDRDLSNGQTTRSVLDGHSNARLRSDQIRGDSAKHSKGHGIVGLIVKMADRSPMAVLSDLANEHHLRAGIFAVHRRPHSLDVDRCRTDGTLLKAGAARYRRNQCNLVALSEDPVVFHEFVIHRDPHRAHDLRERGYRLRQMDSKRSHSRRAFEFEYDCVLPRSIPSHREQSNHNLHSVGFIGTPGTLSTSDSAKNEPKHFAERVPLMHTGVVLSAPAKDASAFRRLLTHFWRYRRGFGVGLVALVVTQAFSLCIPPLLKRATNGLVAGNQGLVETSALLLIVVALIGALARIASRVLIFHNGRRVEYDLRNQCFDHLLRLSPNFFQRMSLGQIMSRMVSDLMQVRLLLGPGLLNLVNTSLVYAVVIPVLFVIHPQLALLSLLPFPILLLSGRVFARRIYRLSQEGQDRLGNLSAKVQENLLGAESVRAYVREKQELERFAELNQRYVETNLGLARQRGIMFPFMGLAGAFGTIIVFFFGGKEVIRGTMSMGDFVQFNAYLALLAWPTLAMGWMISLTQRGLAALARLETLLSEPPGLFDGSEPAPAEFHGTIEVRNLTIQYERSASKALDGVSFSIEPGELVAIVGRTGSGKSTLVRVMARLFEIPRGVLFFDGIDAVDLPLSYPRRHIAYAGQKPQLFSRTVRSNLNFYTSDDDQIWGALEEAAVREDVSGLPDQLDSLIGERGINLSGGQNQRIALARAFLEPAQTLILDDPLSAVDQRTEAQILKRLTTERGQQTVIVATHRMSLAERADRVIVLDGGRIIETGAPKDLRDRHGRYAALLRLHQFEETEARA